MSIEGTQGGGMPSSVVASALSQKAAAETVTPDASATPQSTTEQKPDKFASKFAALTRKEKAVREQEELLKKTQASISEKENLFKTWEQEKQELLASKDSWKKLNPFEAIKEMGYTKEQLIEMIMNDEQPTPEMKLQRMRSEMETGLKSELETLKAQIAAEREERTNREREEADKQYQQTVEGFKKQISQTIQANGDTYELIQANNAHDMVFEVIEEFYKANNKILPIEDAAKAVEAHLEEEASKILKLKKFQQTSKQPEASKSTESATLSNSMSSELPKLGDKKLSDSESKARAARLLRWNE